jgi:anti-sigma factor RsiW
VITINCDDLLEQIMDFLDGEIPETIRIAIEAHLSICPHCGGIVATYRATITFSRSLPKCEKPLPEGVEARFRTMLAQMNRDSCSE